jgi:TP901 family phage tail tape measure protein
MPTSSTSHVLVLKVDASSAVQGFSAFQSQYEKVLNDSVALTSKATALMTQAWNSFSNSFNSVANNINQAASSAQKSVSSISLAFSDSSKTVDSMSSSLNKLVTGFNEVGKAAEKLSDSTKEVNTQVGETQTNLFGLSRPFISITGLARALSSVLTFELAFYGLQAVKDALKDTVKLFVEFQDALVNVRRNADLTAEQTLVVAKALDNLSKEIPMSAVQLANIASVAGQLGIQGVENILTFTESIAKISVALDLSEEQTAVSMARMLNLFSLGTDKVMELGNVFNELARQSTATSKELIEMTERMGGTAAALGLTAGETVALAAALRDAGGGVEVSTTAMIQLMTKLISKIGDVAIAFDLNATELALAMKTQPIQAIKLVLDKANELAKAQGPSALTSALSQLGLEGVRVEETFIKLVSQSEKLDFFLKEQAQAIAENNSVNKEFAIVNENLSKKYELLKNEMQSFARTIGAEASPVISKAMEYLTNGFEALNVAAEFWFGKKSEDVFAPLTSSVDDLNKVQAEIAEIQKKIKDLNNEFRSKQEAQVYWNTYFPESFENIPGTIESYKNALRELNERLFDLKQKERELTQALKDKANATNEVLKLDAQSLADASNLNKAYLALVRYVDQYNKKIQELRSHPEVYEITTQAVSTLVGDYQKLLSITVLNVDQAKNLSGTADDLNQILSSLDVKITDINAALNNEAVRKAALALRNEDLLKTYNALSSSVNDYIKASKDELKSEAQNDAIRNRVKEMLGILKSLYDTGAISLNKYTSEQKRLEDALKNLEGIKSKDKTLTEQLLDITRKYNIVTGADAVEALKKYQEALELASRLRDQNVVSQESLNKITSQGARELAELALKGSEEVELLIRQALAVSSNTEALKAFNDALINLKIENLSKAFGIILYASVDKAIEDYNKNLARAAELLKSGLITQNEYNQMLEQGAGVISDLALKQAFSTEAAIRDAQAHDEGAMAWKRYISEVDSYRVSQQQAIDLAKTYGIVLEAEVTKALDQYQSQLKQAEIAVSKGTISLEEYNKIVGAASSVLADLALKQAFSTEAAIRDAQAHDEGAMAWKRYISEVDSYRVSQQQAIDLAKTYGIVLEAEVTKALDQYQSQLKQAEIAVSKGTISLEEYNRIVGAASSVLADLALKHSFVTGEALKEAQAHDEGAMALRRYMSAALESKRLQDEAIDLAKKYGVVTSDLLNKALSNYSDVEARANMLREKGVLSYEEYNKIVRSAADEVADLALKQAFGTEAAIKEAQAHDEGTLALKRYYGSYDNLVKTKEKHRAREKTDTEQLIELTKKYEIVTGADAVEALKKYQKALTLSDTLLSKNILSQEEANKVAEAGARELAELAEKGSSNIEALITNALAVSSNTSALEAFNKALQNLKIEKLKDAFDVTFSSEVNKAIEDYNKNLSRASELLKSGAITQNEYNQVVDQGASKISDLALKQAFSTEAAIRDAQAHDEGTMALERYIASITKLALHQKEAEELASAYGVVLESQVIKALKEYEELSARASLLLQEGIISQDVYNKIITEAADNVSNLALKQAFGSEEAIKAALAHDEGAMALKRLNSATTDLTSTLEKLPGTFASVRASVQNQIDGINELIYVLKTGKIGFLEFGASIIQLGSSLLQSSGLLDLFGSKVGRVVSDVSSITSGVIGAGAAFTRFISGDIVGGVIQGVSAIGDLVKGFGDFFSGLFGGTSEGKKEWEKLQDAVRSLSPDLQESVRLMSPVRDEVRAMGSDFEKYLGSLTFDDLLGGIDAVGTRINSLPPVMDRVAEAISKLTGVSMKKAREDVIFLTGAIEEQGGSITDLISAYSDWISEAEDVSKATAKLQIAQTMLARSVHLTQEQFNELFQTMTQANEVEAAMDDLATAFDIFSDGVLDSEKELDKLTQIIDNLVARGTISTDMAAQLTEAFTALATGTQLTSDQLVTVKQLFDLLSSETEALDGSISTLGNTMRVVGGSAQSLSGGMQALSLNFANTTNVASSFNSTLNETTTASANLEDTLVGHSLVPALLELSAVLVYAHRSTLDLSLGMQALSSNFEGASLEAKSLTSALNEAVTSSLALEDTLVGHSLVPALDNLTIALDNSKTALTLYNNAMANAATTSSKLEAALGPALGVSEAPTYTFSAAPKETVDLTLRSTSRQVDLLSSQAVNTVDLLNQKTEDASKSINLLNSATSNLIDLTGDLVLGTSEYNTQLDELNTNLSKTREQHQKYTSDLDTLKSQISLTQDQISSTQKALDFYSKRISSLESQIRNLTDLYTSGSMNVVDYQRNLSRLTDELNAAKASYDLNNSSLEDLNKQLEDLTSAYDETKSKVESVSSEIGNLSGQIEDLNKKYQDSSNLVKSLGLVTRSQYLKAQDNQRRSLELLLDLYERGEISLGQYQEAVDTLNKSLEALKEETDDQQRAIRDATETLSALGLTTSKDVSKAYDNLISSQEDLKVALDSGLITLDQYNEGLQILQESYDEVAKSVDVVARKREASISSLKEELGLITAEDLSKAASSLADKQALLLDLYNEGQITLAQYNNSIKTLQDSYNELALSVFKDSHEEEKRAVASELGLTTTQDLIEAQVEYQRKLALVQELLQAGEITQIEYNNAVDALNESLNDLFLSMNQSDRQQRRYETAQKLGITTQRDLLEAQEEMNREIADLDELLRQGEITQAQHDAGVKQLRDSYEELVQSTNDVARAFQSAQETAQALGIVTADELSQATADAADKLGDLNLLLVSGQITQAQYEMGVQSLSNSLTDLYNNTAGVVVSTDELSSSLDTSSSSVVEMSSATIELNTTLDQTNDLFVEATSNSLMLTKAIAGLVEQVINLGFYGSLLPGMGKTLGGTSIPGRASGGPVRSNRAYIVGEEGPELFIPKSDGYIVRSGAVKTEVSNESININIFADVIDQQAVDRFVAKLERKLKNRANLRVIS